MSDNEASFADKADLAGLVRKARRRTIWRNIVISLAITLVVLAGGWFANLQLQYRSSDHALRDIEMLKRISGPNLYESNYRIRTGFLRGNLDVQRYKLIEGVPVVWDTQTYEFSSWGTFRRDAGIDSSLSLIDPSMKEQGFDYARPYDPGNGEREMLFYLPAVAYPRYLNELPQLSDMDGRKLVELAVSFDTNYTVDQIKAMLPSGIHPVWYWVDTYSNMKPYQAGQMPDGSPVGPFPDDAGRVYGFGVHPDWSEVAEDDFLDALEAGLHADGKYKGEFERIYDYLRKDKAKPDTGDVRIWGVVVTGSADSLKALQGQKYVKAAVLGAITDRY